MEFSKVLAVVGPTASGKTWLAVQLAKKFNGEIISCDSMQIYRYMTVGTAKPTALEMEGIPHHLVDFLDPDQPFSVAEYVELARAKASEITQRGRLPILAGGTGMLSIAKVIFLCSHMLQIFHMKSTKKEAFSGFHFQG